MKKLATLVSLIGLAFVIVPVLMYLGDAMDKSRMQMLMLAGTALWFASVPFWMDRKQ